MSHFIWLVQKTSVSFYITEDTLVFYFFFVFVLLAGLDFEALLEAVVFCEFFFALLAGLLSPIENTLLFITNYIIIYVP